jgi:glycosyltransferase involved in cell wall biosynthesis
MDKQVAMKEMGLPEGNVNILFGGSFANARKNAPLAKAAIKVLENERVSGAGRFNLIEMKGFNRHQVAMLLNGCDMLLLPTKSEGSPQVLKEAMACNCPVVATEVADIAFLLEGVTNSYVTTFDPKDVAEKIQRVIDCGERTNGRKRIEELKLDNPQVAETILGIYKSIVK